MGLPPRVSAIIINYESGKLLSVCLRSLAEQDLALHECIVVDNGSTDGSAAEAAGSFPDASFLRPGSNLGYAGGANFGARTATGEVLLFLNPDVRLQPGCLRALAASLERRDVGVVGPVIDLETSHITEYGSTIDPLGTPVGIKSPRARPLFVSGSALATKTELFRRLGGFDERFFMFMEDVDYCWRVLRTGHDVTVAGDAHLFHAGGASTPGGYATLGGWKTTTFRVAFRERNTFAMLLKCSPASILPLVIPLYLLQSIGTAAVAALQGHASTARWILKGLAWNVRQLAATLELRRQTKTEAGASREVIARLYRGVAKMNVLLRFGMPDIDSSSETVRQT